MVSYRMHSTVTPGVLYERVSQSITRLKQGYFCTRLYGWRTRFHRKQETRDEKKKGGIMASPSDHIALTIPLESIITNQPIAQQQDDEVYSVEQGG
jgi:hypothetical protein